MVLFCLKRKLYYSHSKNKTKLVFPGICQQPTPYTTIFSETIWIPQNHRFKPCHPGVVLRLTAIDVPSWFKHLNFASASQFVHANGVAALAAVSSQAGHRIFHRGMPEADSPVELLIRRCKTGGLGGVRMDNEFTPWNIFLLLFTNMVLSVI